MSWSVPSISNDAGSTGLRVWWCGCTEKEAAGLAASFRCNDTVSEDNAVDGESIVDTDVIVVDDDDNDGNNDEIKVWFIMLST